MPELKLNLKKEIPELIFIVIAVLCCIIFSLRWWWGLIIFAIEDITYLIIYNYLSRKYEDKTEKPVKQEVNFHEYDEDDEDNKN